MAECTLVRCSQEKRFFRKEFQRWSRNILFVVGLERIAEEYMGKEKWKEFVLPFKDDEPVEPSDWSPDELCHFCQAKKGPLFDLAGGVLQPGDDCPGRDLDDHLSISSDQGINCTQPNAKGDQPLDLSIHSSRKTGCNDLNSGHHSGSDSDSGVSGSNCFLKVPHIPVKPGIQSKSPATFCNSKRRFDPNGKKSYTEDELQAALRDIQSGKLGTRRAAVIYGIPRSTLRNKVYKLAMEKDKKNRGSTGSNGGGAKSKISHSEPKENDSEPLIKEPNQASLANVSSNNAEATSSASESLRQLLKQTITQKNSGTIRTNSELPKVDSETALSWPVNQETLAAFNSLNSADYSQSINPLLTQVLANIQHLALSKGAADVNDLRDLVASNTKESQFSLLPEMIRRLAEEQLELECERQNNANNNNEKHTLIANDNNNSSLVKEGNWNGCEPSSLSNVILKIPSYKPTKFSNTAAVNSNSTTKSSDHHTPGTTQPRPLEASTTSSQQNSGINKQAGITVSLKELIAKSINQRMGNSDDGDIKSNSATETKKRYYSSENEEEINQRLATASDLSSDSLHKSESKRTRPKRGRYRNYDTDNLTQAVRAVQRGEMSVHRAGTYFGVPHSTLEYKVKERHLLRPKKRDRVRMAGTGSKRSVRISKLLKNRQSEPSPNGMSSSQPEDDDTEDDMMDDETSPTVNSSNTTTNATTTEVTESGVNAATILPSHLSLWQNMPFFPMDLSQVTSNGFFASQMMKKLQENVRLQEEMQQQNNGKQTQPEEFNLHPSNTLHGMGILESLIKSTLEKSIASTESRLVVDSKLSIPNSRALFPEVTVAENSRKAI